MADNPFIDAIDNKDDEKKISSALPGYLDLADITDDEYDKLALKLNLKLPKKEINAEEYGEKQLEKVIYEPHIEVFDVCNEGSRFLYNSLMAEIYNNFDEYLAAPQVYRNWDKEGDLTIVVEYVKVITEKVELAEENSKPKPTKVEKVSEQMKDNPTPHQSEQASFVDLADSFQVPEELEKLDE